MKKIIIAATITGALFMATIANAQKETPAAGAAPKAKTEVKKEKKAKKVTDAQAPKADAKKEPKAKEMKDGAPANSKKEMGKPEKAKKPAAEKK